MNEEQKKALALARARRRASQSAAQAEQPSGFDLGTALNRAGEAMTFGLVGEEADARVRSFIKGTPYEEELARLRGLERAFEERNPGAAVAADVGGAVMGALLPGGAIGSLGRGSGLLARGAASGAVGGAGAGIYGFMEGEGNFDQRLDNALSSAGMGAALGAAVPIAGAGIQRTLDNRAVRRAMRNAPSAAGQRTASGGAYSAFEDAGAEITPEAFGRLQQGVLATLGEGADSLPGGASLTPKSAALANTVRQMGAQIDDAATAGKAPMVPLTAIEQLRRRAGSVADDVNPIGRSTADGRLGIAAIDNIDTFVDSLKASDVAIGDGEAAISALKKARGLWSKSIKTQMIEDVLDKQDDYLGGQASAIRNGIGSLLRNKAKRSKFTKAEQDALRKIVGGNGLTRALRLMGNGIGRQGQMAGGGILGGPAGLLAGAISGEVTANMANRNAVRSLEQARNAIASGALRGYPQTSQTARMISEGILRRLAAAQSAQP